MLHAILYEGFTQAAQLFIACGANVNYAPPANEAGFFEGNRAHNILYTAACNTPFAIPGIINARFNLWDERNDQNKTASDVILEHAIPKLRRQLGAPGANIDELTLFVNYLIGVLEEHPAQVVGENDFFFGVDVIGADEEDDGMDIGE